MSILYNPRWRLGWSIATAAGAAALAGTDWLLRSAGVSPCWPPPRASCGCRSCSARSWRRGGPLDRHLLTGHRGFLLTIHRTPLPACLSWRFQRVNLLLNGWLIVALLALIGWCYYSGVFALLVLLAVNAVQFAANRKFVGPTRRRTAAVGGLLTRKVRQAFDSSSKEVKQR